MALIVILLHQTNQIMYLFSEHSEHVHGIEYPIQTIDQIIYRKS